MGLPALTRRGGKRENFSRVVTIRSCVEFLIPLQATGRAFVGNPSECSLARRWAAIGTREYLAERTNRTGAGFPGLPHRVDDLRTRLSRFESPSSKLGVVARFLLVAAVPSDLLWAG
jgi:hypothetical protein